MGFPAKIIIFYRGFLKWGYPQIIHFSRIFPYKPSILGYRVPPFTEPPIYPGSEQPAGTQALPRRGGKPWWRPSQGLASSRDGKSNEMNEAIHQFHGWYHWYIYIYMYVCMYACVSEWMNEWINDWLNEWMNPCMHACMDECMYVCYVISS